MLTLFIGIFFLYEVWINVIVGRWGRRRKPLQAEGG